MSEKFNDDYTVYATFIEDGETIDSEEIGEVQLVEKATFKDMPQELEINGFVYKIEQ